MTNNESSVMPPDTEELRPTYHYTPRRNFMNDPNGLVYLNGQFLLFHQFNPHGNQWGHIGWKQAISSDLIDWTHLPLALSEEYGVMAFSGSAVVDYANSTGFGREGIPPVIAIYTGHRVDNGMESPCLAYSQDMGSTWVRYTDNPVLPPEQEFRDPKVFWDENTQQWILIMARAAEKRLRFYRSSDLRTWTFLNEFGPAGAPPSTVSNWECPDLFRLPIEGEEGEPGGTRWVLHIGTGDGHPNGGSGGQYFVGDFDGTKFVNDNPSDTVLWSDYGKDNYAALSWSGITGPLGKVYWIGWMSNWRYADKVPTHPWRNGLTIPRLLSLRSTSAGLRLVQRPAPQLNSLRREQYSLTPIRLHPDEPVEIDGVEGAALEIMAEFEVGAASECGLAVRVGSNERTLVGVDMVNQQIFVERADPEPAFSEHFAGRHTAPLCEVRESETTESLAKGNVAEGNLAEGNVTKGRLRLHVFVDSASIEVFAQDGLVVLTELIFPRPESRSIYAYASGGEAVLVSLNIWKLNPATARFCDTEVTHVEQGSR